MVRAGSAQAGVLGAAMLAAVGAGMYATAEEAARGMATLAEEFAPEAARGAMYGERFARYTKLYPALRECLEGKKSESIEAYV
jgi:xylulokinase